MNNHWEKSILRGIGVIFIVSLVSVFLDHMGFFRAYEHAALDSFFAFNDSIKSQDIVIVEIDDKSYQNIFNSTSPLVSCNQHEPDNKYGIVDLINDISIAEPSVIGVDLDTSSTKYDGNKCSFLKVCLEKASRLKEECLETYTPIVWAVERINDKSDSSSSISVTKAIWGKDDPTKITRRGIAMFPIEPDGIVRRYERKFNINGVDWKSFPYAILDAYGHHFSSKNYNEVLLNFPGNRYTFHKIPAQYVQTLAKHPTEWKKNNLLKDKIVLIGGTFRVGRDVHVTPVGLMPGVNLIAHAIQSELDNEFRLPADKIIAGIIEFFCGVIFLSCRRFFSAIPWPALEIVVIGSTFFVLAGIGSLIAFNTLGHWFNFIPVIFAALLHQLYEQGIELRQTRCKSS